MATYRQRRLASAIAPLRAILIGLATAAALPALARHHPEKPARAIVPFVAGSSNDILARMISPP